MQVQHVGLFMVKYYSLFLETVDDSLTLDSLLIQLRSQVTPIWYKFGLSLGISKDTLNRYVGYPDEECIVEVLDYWLRNREIKPTWRDVATALKDVEVYQLAEKILNVYKTGIWIQLSIILLVWLIKVHKFYR